MSIEGLRTLKPFDLLSKYTSILGTTKMSFWPILNAGRATNPHMESWGAGTTAIDLLARIPAGVQAIFDVFEPHQHVGGVHSVRLIASLSPCLQVNGDNAAHSFAGDAAFSIGVWAKLDEAVGTARTLAAKYDTAGTLREYSFRLDTSGYLELELYDESADKTEIGTGATAITPFQWAFCVSTYDGTAATPDVHLYLDGVDTNSAGTTTEVADYIGMEDTATPLLFGAEDDEAAPANEFNGRMAMPFITGKELSSDEVGQLYRIGKLLMGI